MQRLFDICFSFTALAFLSPIFIIIIMILKFTGEGEIFFVQKRIGKNKNFINLYKFATMLKNSPNMGTGTLTIGDDPRILPFGKFLRKTKINELPQLFNVFIGDMSIIGPRPQTERCFNAFPTNSQNEIIKVKPGLSGIGSIIFRDEESMVNENADQFYDEVIMPYKGKVEEWYVREQNILMYFKMIILTIIVVASSSLKTLKYFFHNLPKPPAELDQWLREIR